MTIDELEAEVIRWKEYAKELENQLDELTYVTIEQEKLSSQKKSISTKEGLEEAKKQGKKLGNPQWHKSIDAARLMRGKNNLPPSVELIELIKTNRANGKSLRYIVDLLNSRGLTTPSGNKWHASTLNNFLSKPLTLTDPSQPS